MIVPLTGLKPLKVHTAAMGLLWE